MRGRLILACIALAMGPVVTQGRAEAPVSASGAPAAAAPGVATGHWHESSLADYRQHLQMLSGLVAACAKARNPEVCDPALVGEDDHVALGEGASAEHRLVRLGWLRVLLSKAQEKDEDSAKLAAGLKPVVAGRGPKEAGQPPPATTTELLEAAQARLAHDLAQTDAAAVAAQDRTAERKWMQEILAGRDFRGIEEPSARDGFLERLGNWINQLFEKAAEYGGRSPWIGRALVGGFLLAVCVGLAWGLLQMERRWRIRLVPDDMGPGNGAASARDWQLWLEDARKAAAAGLWREAIHFVYWASISRLESRRLWPADRARTPREYLALLAPEDPRRPGLKTLTGSFERTWYGGRAAGESDYAQAEQVASALISGNSSPTGGGR